MMLSKETSESFGKDFVDIYTHIAETIRKMIDGRTDNEEYEDMNEINEGKGSLKNWLL